MGRIIVVVAFFLLLAASAAFDFPASFFAEPMPRGMRALDWIVTTFATGPFGNLGGAALFIGLGVVATALALRREYGLGAGARTMATHDELPTDATPRRRRQLAPAALAHSEANATSTKGQIAALLGAKPGSAEAQDARPAAQDDYARLIMQIVEANQPPPPPDGPLDPIIDAARRRPIVFRQQLASSHETGLSFYGGRPVVPAGFAWPRASADPASKPLHFLMQCDCRELSSQDATGLLPTDGVLYFFLDFEWGKDDGFRFVHHPGPAEGWQPLDPPADLGPVHGDQGAWQMAGCTSKVDNADDHVPRLMPYAPFAPVAFDYPTPPADEMEDEEAHRLFWHDKSCAQALLAVQHSAGSRPAPRDINSPRPPFARPFAAFPHDFGAIRVLAAKAIKELEGPYLAQRKSVLPDLSDGEREARFAEWLAQAKELYLYAAARPMGEAVPVDVADQLWDWIVALESVFAWGFDGLVSEAIDLSLGYASAARDTIPAEWIAEAARHHTLAHEFVRDEHPDHSQPDAFKRHEEKKARGELIKVREIHAPTPTHMFGPPSYVQGYVEELMDEHVLLLEITSGSAPGHHFGDGVLQYLVRSEDLREGRLDRVKSVLSGY